MQTCKAYIPLRRKIPGFGGWRWAMPPTPEFCVGDTNMLVSWSQHKPLNLRNPQRQTLKFAFPPKPNPNASQWNIGCVGFQTQIFCVGHVHFIFCVSISFALGTPFPVEYGLKTFADPQNSAVLNC